MVWLDKCRTQQISLQECLWCMNCTASTVDRNRQVKPWDVFSVNLIVFGFQSNPGIFRRLGIQALIRWCSHKSWMKNKTRKLKKQMDEHGQWNGTTMISQFCCSSSFSPDFKIGYISQTITPPCNLFPEHATHFLHSLSLQSLSSTLNCFIHLAGSRRPLYMTSFFNV